MAVVRLTRPLSGEAGDEAHDGVVINDGGGEEDEVEVGVGLVDVKRAELGLGVPGGGLRVLSSAERRWTNGIRRVLLVWIKCGLNVD